jgi:hypothetical protein
MSGVRRRAAAPRRAAHDDFLMPILIAVWKLAF